jgi:hypothetical protein
LISISLPIRGQSIAAGGNLTVIAVSPGWF